MTDTANSPAVTSTNRWLVRVAGAFIALGGLVIAVLRVLSARGWTVIVGPIPHFALEILAWGIVGTGTCGLMAVAARKFYAQSDRLARLTAIFLTLVVIVGGLVTALVIFGAITWVALEGVTRLHTPGTDRHWAVEATSGLGDTSYTFYVATNPFLFGEAGLAIPWNRGDLVSGHPARVLARGRGRRGSGVKGGRRPSRSDRAATLEVGGAAPPHSPARACQ